MTTPRQAKRTSDRAPRTYAWPPLPPHEFELISVTSASEGGLPKPFLVGWAANQAAQCALDDHEIIGAMLDKGMTQAAYDHIRNARNRDRDAKAKRGTIVHSALEHYLKGTKPDLKAIEEELVEKKVPAKLRKGAANMIRGLLDFLSDEEPEVYWSESTVYSRTHRYAGTPDLIASMAVGGTFRPVIIDVKTSKSIYDETALQTCAYSRADFVGLDDGTEMKLLPEDAPLPTIDYGVVVRPLTAKSNGRLYEKAVFTHTDELFQLFLHTLGTTTLKGVLDTARRPS